MKKQMPVLVAIAILLAVPSCALFRGGDDPASTFKTFEDTWTVSLAAYDAHCDRVNLGKVEPAKEKLADAAWLQFRATFRAAFVAASRNWNAPTPPTLEVEAKSLVSTLNQ